MDVKVLTSTQAASNELTRLIHKCDRMSFAVAWATHNAVLDAALAAQAKFEKLIIGTHRCVTDPAVLAACKDLPSFRAIKPTGRLFHPKVYLFHTGSTVDAFVGSNNLTANGFGRNTEAGVLLSADCRNAQVMSLLNYVDKQWARGRPSTTSGSPSTPPIAGAPPRQTGNSSDGIRRPPSAHGRKT